MRKTVESYRIALEDEIQRWSGFARALRKPDLEAFDELMDACKSYASEGSCATNSIVFEPMVMSILLAQQVRIQKLERQLKRHQRKAATLPMANFTDGNILDRLDDLEAPPLVKIYIKIVRRKYKRRYYDYPKHLVPVSTCYNELIVEFLEKRVEERIYILGETMHLALTQRKSEATQNGIKKRLPSEEC